MDEEGQAKIYLPLAGGTMAGDIAMGSHKVSGLPTPTAEDEAARKAYVDSLAAPFDPFAQFLEFIPWVSVDGFYKGGDTGYDVIPYGVSVLIRTGNATNRDAFLETSDYWPLIAEPGKIVTVEIPITYLNSIAAVNVWLRMARDFSDPPSETMDHWGWKIINADLYASNADGATQKITDTGINLSAGTQHTRLKMVFTPGTNVKYYVNDILKVTHTVNLPSLQNYTMQFQIRTLANAQKVIYIGRVLIQKAY